MSNYTGVSPSIFDEPEYRDEAELIIAIYLIVKSDMIGVCPIIISHVAKACRTSPAKVRQTLLYFEKIGKLKIGEQKVTHRRSYPLPFGTHICWYSKAYHSLRKGKASVKQQSMVSQLTVKWQLTGVFGQKFAYALSQLYATKYKITITINQLSPSEYEYDNENKDKSDTESEDKPELTTADKPPVVGKGEKKKPKSETDPDHANFVKFWHDKYEEQFDRKYHMEKGKDGILIGKMLHFARNGRPSENEEWKTELAGMVEMFFRLKDVGVAGHTIGTFYYRRHELREAWNE